MAELTCTESGEASRAWANRRLRVALGGKPLPEHLDELRPIELALVLREMERATTGSYPTELFDAITSLDDCVHYMAIKRGRP